MQGNCDIFFSYSHRDSGIATHLVKSFEEAGLRCFLAEKDLSAGELWEPVIREAIQSAKCMLLLMTPRSKNSLWVAVEAGAAWALEKKLIAALMFVEEDELIQPIRRYQTRIVETPEQIKALVNELSTTDAVARDTISGQWVDKHNDVIFFKQYEKRVVGFYDYGSGNRKVGVYLGTMENGVFEYQWKWLNGQLEGHGRITLTRNGNCLSGKWWYGKNDSIAEQVDYNRVSDKMPIWLDDRDFEEYRDFLAGR